MRRSQPTSLAGLFLLLAGCAAPGPLKKVWPFGKGPQVKVVAENFSEAKLEDVKVQQEMIGVGGKGKWMPVVTGFLTGKVVYQAIREDGSAEERPAEGFHIFADAPEFDPSATTDSQGIYRIRFKIPILKDRAVAEGKLRFNPDWKKIRDEEKGVSYEPPFAELPFQIVYSGKVGWVFLVSELPKKMVVFRREAPWYTERYGRFQQEERKRREAQQQKEKKKAAGEEEGMPGLGGFEGFPALP